MELAEAYFVLEVLRDWVRVPQTNTSAEYLFKAIQIMYDECKRMEEETPSGKQQTTCK